MRAWRRTEPRIARPFFAVSAMEGALKQASIFVGEREFNVSDGAVQLDPADFENLQVAISPRLNESDVRKTLKERASQFSLVMTLRDPMFKRRVIHKEWSLDGEIPDRLLLDEEIVHEFGHKRELHVTLAILLSENVEVSPGWPHRKGSWLAKHTFQIKLRNIRPTFDLRPMTREMAKEFTGSKGALLHVEVRGEFLAQQVEEGEYFASCYIAEDVFNSMQRATSGAILQNIVMAEVVCMILAEAADDISAVEEVPKDTPLRRILEQLGRNFPLPLNELKEIVRNPVQLRALVHDRTDLVASLRNI